jgi:hypothetical protein
VQVDFTNLTQYLYGRRREIGMHLPTSSSEGPAHCVLNRGQMGRCDSRSEWATDVINVNSLVRD